MDLIVLVAISLIIGFLAAISGIGGGALLTPALILSGVDARIAVGASLGGVALTSLVSSLEYLRQRFADIKLAAILLIASLPGAFIGVQLAYVLPVLMLEKALGVFLMVLAMILFFHPNPLKLKLPFCMECCVLARNGKEFKYEAPLALLIPLGFVAGMASGLFGIGGGVLIVPAMLIGGIPAHVAIATSCIMVNLNADFSLLAHYLAGGLSLDYLLFAGPGLAIGAFIGAKFAERIDAKWIRIVLAMVLLLMAIVLLLR